MKSTGITKNIDQKGRIVIPAEIRRSFDIKRTDPIEICVENNNIILRKATNACIFCGSSENVLTFKGKTVCTDCIHLERHGEWSDSFGDLPKNAPYGWQCSVCGDIAFREHPYCPNCGAKMNGEGGENNVHTMQ